LFVAVGSLLFLFGCSPPSRPTTGQVSSSIDARSREELFNVALNNLHQLEQFQPQAMLEQVRQQLNQSVDWKRPVDWRRDPMLDTLPPEVEGLPMLLSLEDQKLNSFDALHLQETVTLQDVSRLATADISDEIQRVCRLFDWTVRNIQPSRVGELGTDDQGQPLRPMHLPYQSLFFGRGDHLDRAWIFLLLCRQQDLDAVVLAVPGASADETPRPWAVGVIIDDEIYPFDLTLGLPILGKDGHSPASLTELAEDEMLLRQLDLDAEHPYPLKTADLESLVALVEASPGYLARRMMVLEGKLAGDRKVVLTTKPSEVAARAMRHAHVHRARLWGVPFERLLVQFSPRGRLLLERELAPYRVDLLPPAYQRPVADLQRGRILHLKGILAAGEEEPNANGCYQHARLADDDIDVPSLDATQRAILHRAKEDASYWLGLVAYERGRYRAAIEHFEKRALAAGSDETTRSETGRWTAGAMYNLGRAYEALGEVDQAIKVYEQTPGAQRHGNLLRVKWLKNGTKLPAGSTPDSARPSPA
jgi:tetratricopeptide (TPR) repeat protein